MDATNRKKLIATRAVAKASLTRLVKYIDDFSVGSDIQGIIVRLKELSNIRDKFEGAQSQLEMFEDFELHAQDRDCFETMFFDAEARMNALVMPSSGVCNSHQESDQHPSSSTSASKRSIKLPTIKLPSFAGDVTQFRHFHDTFVSLIVNNESLDNIQRFHYLLSSLTGEAHNVIANLPVTNANFQVAFDSICTRYNNARLIASAHIKQLLSLPSMNKVSASELRALLNQAMSNMNAIKALELTVPLEELLMSQLILEKTEMSIRKEYESTLDPKTFPTLQQLYEFLETKCKSIEIINSSPPTRLNNLTSNRIQDSSSRKHTTVVKQSYMSTALSCIYCNQSHALYKCHAFTRLSVQERRDIVKQRNLCFNCLKSDHQVNTCKSVGCRTCGKWHHTLIHLDVSQQSEPRHYQQDVSRNNGVNDCRQQSESMTASYCTLKVVPSKQILLSTALVKVKDSNGRLQTCRALLDSGSQSCFISESCAQRLKLRRRPSRVPIQGIGNTTSETKHTISVEISSCSSNFTVSVDCLVLPKVTDDLPGHFIDSSSWNLPTHLPLADPAYSQPGKIDILLGTEVCSYIQRSGKLTRDLNHPVLQETEFGWILSGRYKGDASCTNISRRPVVSCFAKTDTDIHTQLQKFWELEELHLTPRTRDERECETHFVQNTIRDSSGRFVVRLPFREDPKKLGDSFQMAAKRFYLHERKMSRNQNLKEDYTNFMDEYEDLGHMETTHSTVTPVYYMPHHAVFKDSSSTTKTRVVFDCSAKTNSGTSLNDLLLVGPTIQQDLCSIIVRFRTHPIAFTADIAKMYRQIQMDLRDCAYQRILWRRKQTDALQEYQLKTVTYGMACSPFLATRCLQHLAEDEAQTYPKESDILLNDFYVDDCMSGSQTLEEALQTQKNLIDLLSKGGFSLRKWCSNSPELLESISPELRESQLPLRLDDDIKTLGLLWHPVADKFQIVNNIRSAVHGHSFTKRCVLSAISSIFDPLGFISPVVILCKMFLQILWQQQLTWDEPLSPELSRSWQELCDQLPMIDAIRINRRILTDGPVNDIQLHGFCDASEKAYGCCIYIRSTNKQGLTTSTLLCSKSRVAPLKKTSLPRLELCGALLLARLYKKVVSALNMKLSNVYLWTDSTIVLAWLAAPSTRWKTFVGNRVSEIQDATTTAEWRHVTSLDNPADMISRGVLPDGLIDNQSWWEGAAWLTQHSSSWPKLYVVPASQHVLDEKSKTICHVATNCQNDIISRFSKLIRLQRVVAYCNRFVANCRKARDERATNDLSLQELQLGLHQCIRMAQQAEYAKEIHQLEHNVPLDGNSKLKSLNPFLDKMHLLRVGGRLQHSDLMYQQKHQIILPPHHLTKLIVEHEHQRMLHAGCQLLLSSLRQQYWIVKGRTTVRHILYHCLTCHKLKAETTHQLMGQLPRPRVESTRPFSNCGTDFTGPFYIKSGSRRSKLKEKCYVAVFVCMATKAVHLEVVSNMSTQAFLAALKRFISRRGRPRNIFSDNGTNFVGAERELREIQTLLGHDQLHGDIRSFTISECISWHFIPPRAPHFGGIWEASVKSFKYHLRRTMGTMCLTLEEMTTLICQIEACLNSRPLIPLSCDPNDPEALTPGHYLIGTAITTIPQPDLGNVKLSLLSRWNILQQQLQLFWRRWSCDYLHHLQQRSKWTSSCSSVQPGALVIVKEDNVPPLCWKLAVIEGVHPGPDGLVRVVTIRTPQGLFKRPITKLCLLPKDGDS